MREPRILVVNHHHTVICGIHDLGKRIFDRLLAAGVTVAYAEAGNLEEYHDAYVKSDPDVVIVNHRDDLTPWAASGAKLGTALTVAVAHNYTWPTYTDLVDRLVAAGFDRVLALDPTVPESPDSIRTTRPLPGSPVRQVRSWPPRIGTFGFAFPHKGFQTVAGEVAKLGNATLVVHAPEAFFNGAQGGPLYGDAIFEACRSQLDPARHVMHWSGTHLPSDEVVELLARNDVNCLLYEPGQPEAGVSSALDYLVAAGRPILVSNCTMFGHAGPAVAWWPATSLGDVLADYEKREQAVLGLRDEWNRDFARLIIEQL